MTEVWVWATPRRRGKRRLRTSLVGGGNEGHGAPSAGVAVPVLSSLGLPKGEKGPPATEKLETWLNLELLGEASFLSHPGKSSLICLILFGCCTHQNCRLNGGNLIFTETHLECGWHTLLWMVITYQQRLHPSIPAVCTSKPCSWHMHH